MPRNLPLAYELRFIHRHTPGPVAGGYALSLATRAALEIVNLADIWLASF